MQLTVVNYLLQGTQPVEYLKDAMNGVKGCSGRVVRVACQRQAKKPCLLPIAFFARFVFSKIMLRPYGRTSVSRRLPPEISLTGS